MRLKKWLERNNIPQLVFADMLGISTSTLSRYISGERRVPLLMAIKIEKLTKKEVRCQDLV